MRRRATHCMVIAAFVVLAMVQTSAGDAVSADSLWPAIDLSGLPVYGGAQGSQAGPDIAWGSTCYLAVWADERTGSWRIYATRVAADGTLLDPDGIVLFAGGGPQGQPAVAFDGENWMVVWVAWPSIAGVRVAQDGTVLDATPFAIDSAQSGDQSIDPPRIAFDGTNFLVMYGMTQCMYYDPEFMQCLDWDDHLMGRFVSPEGAVGLAMFYYALPNVTNYGHDIAFDGTTYLYVWAYEGSGGWPYKVYAQFIDAMGGLFGSPFQLWSGYAAPAGVGLAHIEGPGYLVAWSDAGYGDLDVHFARVWDNGSYMLGGGLLIGGEQSHPAVCALDSLYVVAWRDLRSPTEPAVYAARVDTLGASQNSTGVRISDAGGLASCAAASHGNVALVAWDDYASGSTAADVFAARFDSAGTVLDPEAVRLAPGTNGERPARVASDGTNYLMVWEDSRGEDAPDIYCARVDGDGTVLDESGVPVASGAGYQTDPEVSFDGVNYLVVWKDVPGGESDGDVRCARVTTSAVVLDPSGITVAATAAQEIDPSVCFDGENHLVVWNSGSTVRAARVSPAGAVLDPLGISVASSAFAFYGLSAARGDTASLITYVYSSNIYGRRVSRDGVVMDVTPISVATHANGESWPEAAFAGGQWLVTWQRYGGTSTGQDIYAGRVTAAGAPIDGAGGFVVSTATGYQSDPTVCFDGEDFLVAWSDARSGSGYDVYCARVGTDGALEDAAGISAGALAGDQLTPSLAAGSAGEALLIYSSYEGDEGAHRIWGNRWTPVPEWAGVDGGAVIGRPVLYQNRPNPFNPRTTIRFTLPVDGRVSLDVYDAAGRRVAGLMNDELMTSGAHTAEWNGMDDAGHGVASGVYFVRLTQAGVSAETRVVLVR